jgi:membrane-associated protein
MDKIVQLITQHAEHAHWYIFAVLLCAGLNIPISIDFILICSALIAATIIPEHTIYLFLAVFLGCYFSAMIGYGIGRFFGAKLCKIPFFAKILTPARLDKARSFYEKHGLTTLMIGRFIPFGFRNCLFMSTGLTKASFSKFILRDALACFVWAATLFSLFYAVGQNREVLYTYFKAFNFLIFSIFGATAIGIFWYKRRSTKKA